MKTTEIRIRDPFILPDRGIYFLYGTNCDQNSADRLYVYKSTDLENWSDPIVIFRLRAGTWAKGDLWAPEVHRYGDRYYMFLSLLGKHGLRGTQVFAADAPDKTFTALTDRPVTPYQKSCIDGSLYVENGTPYIVFSADWPDNYDADKQCYVGEIWASELTKDLSAPVGKPFRLF